MLLFLNSLGGGELFLILLVVLMFFGSNKIPDLARGLGRGIREFKEAANGIQREIEQQVTDVKKDVNISKTMDQLLEDDQHEAVHPPVQPGTTAPETKEQP